MEKFSFNNIPDTVKDYEKRAEAIANPSLKSRLLSFFETLEFSNLQSTGITKEDVIRIDADLELEARKNAEGKAVDSLEQKYLEKMINSDLSFKHTLEVPGPGIGRFSDKIEGKINDQDVLITDRYLMRQRMDEDFNPIAPEKENNDETYEGILNKIKLSEEEAKKLFTEYQKIAEDRMNAINKFIEDNKKK